MLRSLGANFVCRESPAIFGICEGFDDGEMGDGNVAIGVGVVVGKEGGRGRGRGTG